MLRAADARRRSAGALVLALALAAGGCGGEEFANDAGPAAAITISAAITIKRVTVSPARFGAGTIDLLVSNQTAVSQRVQLRSERLATGGRPIAQSTGPINPGGTASLKADVDEGTYVVSARVPAIAPATIAVGVPQAGAPDRLLQP